MRYVTLCSCFLILIVCFLLPQGLSAAPKREPVTTYKDLTINHLPAALEIENEMKKVFAVYFCTAKPSSKNAAIFLNLYMSESSPMVRAMLLKRVCQWDPKVILSCMNEDVVFSLIECLEGKSSVLAIQAHDTLTKAFHTVFPRRKESAKSKWKRDREKLLGKYQKAQKSFKTPMVKAPKKATSGDNEGSVVEHQYPVKSLPNIFRFEEEGSDFVFALDYSGSTKKYFDANRGELKFLLRLGLLLNEENRIGAMTFCNEIGNLIDLTSDMPTFETGLLRMRSSSKGTECHDLPVTDGLPQFNWLNKNRMLLLITDEPFASKTRDLTKLYSTMNNHVANGFRFDVMQLTTRRDISAFTLLGYDSYISQGKGTTYVFNPREDRDFSIALAEFFVKPEYREFLKPFFKDMIKYFREHDRHWKK